MVNIDLHELPTECALGLKWDEEADTFIWKASERLQHLVEKGSSNSYLNPPLVSNSRCCVESLLRSLE